MATSSNAINTSTSIYSSMFISCLTHVLLTWISKSLLQGLPPNMFVKTSLAPTLEEIETVFIDHLISLEPRWYTANDKCILLLKVIYQFIIEFYTCLNYGHHILILVSEWLCLNNGKAKIGEKQRETRQVMEGQNVAVAINFAGDARINSNLSNARVTKSRSWKQ